MACVYSTRRTSAQTAKAVNLDLHIGVATLPLPKLPHACLLKVDAAASVWPLVLPFVLCTGALKARLF